MVMDFVMAIDIVMGDSDGGDDDGDGHGDGASAGDSDGYCDGDGDGPSGSCCFCISVHVLHCRRSSSNPSSAQS